MIEGSNCGTAIGKHKVSEIFLLFLKTFLGDGLAPSSQTEGSLLIPSGRQNRPGK
jgi:hypothetical protein